MKNELLQDARRISLWSMVGIFNLFIGPASISTSSYSLQPFAKIGYQSFDVTPCARQE
jgi:hypothetical protein